ncbi:hypothetical protein POTOM_036836 [Populus tomentosa]|uniref:Uncharacterized protein n=1 Tax=Populus tomentosa TaxID=118781 RepID=A0A8X8CN70_POPTO|nr:hypothetical protein POTOM_036836 [Populus tomentosa]
MSRERPRRATLPPAEENIKKLENVINEGNYYGAQQMYKSISARYVSAQRHSEALEILHSGACLQLNNGQDEYENINGYLYDVYIQWQKKKALLIVHDGIYCWILDYSHTSRIRIHSIINQFQVTCGSELAVIYVETLVKAKVPYDDDVLDCIRKIYKTFPQIPLPQDLGEDEDMQQLNEALGDAKIRVDCCLSFLKAAIKWSAEFGAHRNGSPELHVMLGEYVYSESPELVGLRSKFAINFCNDIIFPIRLILDGYHFYVMLMWSLLYATYVQDMTRVSYHFVRGNNPKKFASTLVNFMGKCYPGEDDLAIARAILMYLAMGNLRDANFLMDELKKHAQYKEHDLHRSDLIQFINHLLPTLQRDALPLFNMLRTKYKSSIDREPAFNERLDEIAELFYGVQRRNPLQGMFGDIFKCEIYDGLTATQTISRCQQLNWTSVVFLDEVIICLMH